MIGATGPGGRLRLQEPTGLAGRTPKNASRVGVETGLRSGIKAHQRGAPLGSLQVCAPPGSRLLPLA